MDLTAMFVEQCLIIDYTSSERIQATDLFGLYIKWAKANNEYEMTSKKFFNEVSKKLPEKGRNGKGIFYSRIRFTDYAKQFVSKQYKIEDFK